MLTLNKFNLSETVQKIKLNDKDAFEVFFYEFQPSVFNFLFRYTFDYDLAKDLSQETFIKFWQNRKNMNPSRFPKAYLFKIARNLALNHLDRLPKIYSREDNSNLLSDLCNNPEKEYEIKFILKDFQNAVIQLPERCRVIFMLSRYHNFTYDEIAETLEISLQTVKNQMNKSLAVLRQILHHHID